MTNPLTPLGSALAQRSVRYVLMGVAGANLYAPGGQALFVTEDYDLFLPLDEENLTAAWAAAEDIGADLWLGAEPLAKPRDSLLAARVVQHRAATRASSANGLNVDLSLVMAGFAFDDVWRERRVFTIEGVEIPTARLTHIVTSKATAGRDKDQLFLATHSDALEQLLKKPDLD